MFRKNNTGYPDRPAFWAMGQHMFTTYGLKGDDWAIFDFEDNRLEVGTYRTAVVEFGYNSGGEPQYCLGLWVEPPVDTLFHAPPHSDDLYVVNGIFVPLAKPATPKFKTNGDGYKVELNFYMPSLKTGVTLYWLKYHPLPKFLQSVAPHDYKVAEYTGSGNLAKMPRWNGIVWGNANNNNSNNENDNGVSSNDGDGSGLKKEFKKPPPTSIPSDAKPTKMGDGIPSTDIPLGGTDDSDDIVFDF